MSKDTIHLFNNLSVKGIVANGSIGAGNTTITGDITVSGNLTISGTRTYVNTTTLDVGDNIITLNADLGANPPTENAGLEIMRGTSANVQFMWDESNDRWSTNNQPLATSSLVANGAVSGITTLDAGNTTITGDLTVNNYIIAANGATSAYAAKHLVEYNPTTKDLTYSSKPDASRPYITGYSSEIHVSPVAVDDTGNGTIGDPVKTIAQALVLAATAFETTSAGERKTIILHPGDYAANVTIDTQFLFLTTHEDIGKNTTLSGTLTINKGCTVDGLKMTNLVIAANSSVGTVDLIGCTVSTATTKTSGAYTVFRACDLSSSTLNITGGGSVVIVGGNYGNVTVANTSAGVLAKGVITMGPTTLTSGTMQISDTLVYAASNTASAITQSAGSVLTLNNSQTLIPDLSNVARNTFGGFYSILHSVYDKTNSTFTGTSLAAIDHSQHLNIDKLIVGNTTVNVAITSTAITSNATLATGNTTITGFANVTTTIQGGSSLTIAGAASGITTLAAGNTTITGFANVSTTLQVGTNTATFGTASFIVANGNFGIANSTPGQKLTVSGIIESTTGGIKYPDGTTQTSAGINSGKSIAMAMIFGG